MKDRIFWTRSLANDLQDTVKVQEFAQRFSLIPRHNLDELQLFWDLHRQAPRGFLECQNAMRCLPLANRLRPILDRLLDVELV